MQQVDKQQSASSRPPLSGVGTSTMSHDAGIAGVGATCRRHPHQLVNLPGVHHS